MAKKSDELTEVKLEGLHPVLKDARTRAVEIKRQLDEQQRGASRAESEARELADAGKVEEAVAVRRQVESITVHRLPTLKRAAVEADRRAKEEQALAEGKLRARLVELHQENVRAAAAAVAILLQVEGRREQLEQVATRELRNAENRYKRTLPLLRTPMLAPTGELWLRQAAGAGYRIAPEDLAIAKAVEAKERAQMAWQTRPPRERVGTGPRGQLITFNSTWPPGVVDSPGHGREAVLGVFKVVSDKLHEIEVKK